MFSVTKPHTFIVYFVACSVLKLRNNIPKFWGAILIFKENVNLILFFVAML